MKNLPPEICLLVMEAIPCLSTLGNLILSLKPFFMVFYTYRSRIIVSVVRNQFGCAAKEALFLATGRALEATSEELRVEKVKSFHYFLWTDHHIDCSVLSKLLEIGQVVESLTSIFIKHMAPRLWVKAIGSKPPKSFKHTELRFRRTLYLYWILCQLFHDYSPEFHPRTYSVKTNVEIFEEFYRPLSVREWLDMGFFEECFFPRFMEKICGECETLGRGLCHGKTRSKPECNVCMLTRG